MASELDEARLLLDTAERSRRHAENEVGDIREAMNELTRLLQNLSFLTDKAHSSCIRLVLERS